MKILFHSNPTRRTAPKLDIYLNRDNSVEDCSLSLKFGTEFDYVKLRQYGTNVQGQVVNVSAVNRYKSGTDRSTEFKLDGYYAIAELNM